MVGGIRESVVAFCEMVCGGVGTVIHAFWSGFFSQCVVFVCLFNQFIRAHKLLGVINKRERASWGS
jgi:hypothetical protein